LVSLRGISICSAQRLTGFFSDSNRRVESLERIDLARPIPLVPTLLRNYAALEPITLWSTQWKNGRAGDSFFPLWQAASLRVRAGFSEPLFPQPPNYCRKQTRRLQRKAFAR
jgi:hypothetical protein